MNDSTYLIVPGTGQKISDGTVVVLGRLPEVKWVLHNGHYFYNGKPGDGWYLSSIPSGTVMPFFPSDLYMIRIIDGEVPYPPDPHPCPPGPGPHPCPPGPGPHPFPPGPGPHPFPPGPCPPGPEIYPFGRREWEALRHSMITVSSLLDRDALGSDRLPDGKVVRVNDYEGHVEYFQWNLQASKWELLDFGPRVLLASEAEEKYSTVDEVGALEERVHSNETHLEWQTLPLPSTSPSQSDNDDDGLIYEGTFEDNTLDDNELDAEFIGE